MNLRDLCLTAADQLREASDSGAGLSPAACGDLAFLLDSARVAPVRQPFIAPRDLPPGVVDLRTWRRRA